MFWVICFQYTASNLSRRRGRMLRYFYYHILLNANAVGQSEYLCMVISYLLGDEEAFCEDCGLAIAEGVAD